MMLDADGGGVGMERGGASSGKSKKNVYQISFRGRQLNYTFRRGRKKEKKVIRLDSYHW